MSSNYIENDISLDGKRSCGDWFIVKAGCFHPARRLGIFS
jgi:hypothetical protein